MAKASKIGSFVYNALPAYWRQGWMYRSFTGEAYTMLKARKKEEDIQQLLMQCYVKPIVNKQPENENSVPLNKEPKRTYRKSDTTYWTRKTLKAVRRKARKEQTLYHAVSWRGHQRSVQNYTVIYPATTNAVVLICN
jgi:hypothetical protein